MSNVVRVFEDPAGNYTGGYTSLVIEPVFAAAVANITRGVFQVDVEVAGPVSLQMRVSEDADWVEVSSYTANTIEEVVLANFMRVVVTGDAKAWLGETR